MNSASGEVGPSIEARILDVLDSLTGSERRLADVILEEVANLSSFTAGELAERAGVSNATAARFFQRLGYDSFADMRRKVRQVQDWGSPLYELTGIGERRLAPGDFGLHVALDLQNLTRTAELLLPSDLEVAVKALVQAKTVWVVGFRNSYALATYARALLSNLRPSVNLLPIAGMTMGEELASLGPQDAMLVLGFRRRPLILREIMQTGKDRGAQMVLVADLTAARTASLATVTLRCHNRGHSFFDSYAAPISVINYLCAAVGLGLGDSAVARLEEIETLHEKFDPLVVPSIRRRGRK